MSARFLEIGLHAPDILASLDFYRRLGFTEASVGETWSHPYAAVSDGRIALGLHALDFASPSLTFVQPELLVRLDELEARGVELAFRKVGDDRFNEAGFDDPDQQRVAWLEARTFSPPARPPGQTSLLGWFEEYVLPVRDLDASQAFWEALGFVAVEDDDVPCPRRGLTSDALNIALWQTRQLDGPLLRFSATSLDKVRDTLEARSIGIDRRLPRLFDAGRVMLVVSPEGMPLLVEENAD